eukprot:CAMPEP_0113956686 /NCGR_PEP_ID=MMETSP0011_2-20120614/2221_1 /TAXON_ID=101924 /ORGANISM="Rhodosorus marinus" /LENGTH=245 /DNA_ID=CAMNT_0000966903 /DNA_START=121 /DNA_END=858 /DNA_ORIENTATION=+ /assembly_acc=CAM_ASM_000156
MPEKKTLTPSLETRLLDLSRKELQTLAKLNGIPANQKTVVIVADLAAKGVQPEHIHGALQKVPSQSLKSSYSLRSECLYPSVAVAEGELCSAGDKNQCKVESVSQSGLKQYNQGKRHNDGTACPKENVNGIEDSSAASSLPRVAYLTASEKKARKQFLRRRSSLKFDLEASLARPITWEMKTQTPEKTTSKNLIHDENDASLTPRKRGDYAKHTQLSERRRQEAKQRRITLEDRTLALNQANVAS